MCVRAHINVRLHSFVPEYIIGGVKMKPPLINKS